MVTAVWQMDRAVVIREQRIVTRLLGQTGATVMR